MRLIQKCREALRAYFETPTYTAEEDAVYAQIKDRVELDYDQREAEDIARFLDLEWTPTLANRWSREYRRCIACGEWTAQYRYCIACGNM